MLNDLQRNAEALVAAQTVGLVLPAPTTAADDFYRYDGPKSIKIGRASCRERVSSPV